jgi:hypothetical protein
LVTESLHTSQQRLSLGQVPAANALGTPVSANGIFTLASAFIKKCPDSNAALPFKAFPTLTAKSNCPQPGTPASSPSPMAVKPRQADASPAAQFTATPPSPAELADLVSLDATGLNSAQEVQVNNVQVVDTVEVCAPPTSGQSVSFSIGTDMPKDAMVTFVSGLTTTSVGAQMSGSDIGANVPDGVSGQTYVFITRSAVNGQLKDEDVVAGPAVLEVSPPDPQLDQTVL